MDISPFFHFDVQVMYFAANSTISDPYSIVLSHFETHTARQRTPWQLERERPDPRRFQLQESIVHYVGCFWVAHRQIWVSNLERGLQLYPRPKHPANAWMACFSPFEVSLTILACGVEYELHKCGLSLSPTNLYENYCHEDCLRTHWSNVKPVEICHARYFKIPRWRFSTIGTARSLQEPSQLFWWENMKDDNCVYVCASMLSQAWGLRPIYNSRRMSESLDDRQACIIRQTPLKQPISPPTSTGRSQHTLIPGFWWTKSFIWASRRTPKVFGVIGRWLIYKWGIIVRLSRPVLDNTPRSNITGLF